MKRTAVIAVGGNSLIRAGEKGTIREQLRNATMTARAIVGLLDSGLRIVITHGNGPQVGAALTRSEQASDQVYALPLDVCNATTQGEIGYLLQQSLCNEIARAGRTSRVVTVVTQVVVAAGDAAMLHPTKPVGPFFSRADAEERRNRLGWNIVDDAARGYRRVVPSPEPLEIVEEETIRGLLDAGVLVIACGGGGIPVMRAEDGLRGVEAVIDKDLASSLLARRIGADLLVISTDVANVYLDYKKPTQRPIDRVTVAELEEFQRAGHFPPGSTGPKIRAAMRFVEATGHEAIITSYDHIADALQDKAGTRVGPNAAGTRTAAGVTT